MHEKWKTAVVHLEGAADSLNLFERMERSRALREENLPESDLIERRIALWREGFRNIRSRGTALFIKHQAGRYLVTARHVLFDEVGAKGMLDLLHGASGISPEGAQTQWASQYVEDQIYNVIFRVPSPTELADRKYDQSYLMNLGAGIPSMRPYTFSTPELDLAVISLGMKRERFGDELEAAGYAPISMDDIADGPTDECVDVLTVGYPEAISVIGERNLHPAERNWSSSSLSLPVFSFGKVAMLSDKLDFFWADMSIYPGNSGGPVIENEKLVGIVSAQALVPLDEAPHLEMRVPFARIFSNREGPTTPKYRSKLAESFHPIGSSNISART